MMENKMLSSAKKGKENGSKPKYCANILQAQIQNQRKLKKRMGLKKKDRTFFCDSYFII